MNKKNITLIALVSLVLVVAAAGVIYVTSRPSQEFKGSPIDPPMPAADFTLTSNTSETVSLADFRGKYVLLFFGYTNCPDVCPATMGILSQVYSQLKTNDQASQVQVVLITTDPAHDTPEVMANFVSRFNAEFTGLTGTKEVLQQTWKDYGVMVMDDGMTHSARIYLIDPQGNTRLTYPSAGRAEDIVSDLHILFAGK